MINWLLACLTPQHTSNKSAEKPLKDYSQKTFQGFSHLSDLWWKEVRKVSEMKKYLLLWIYSDWNGNNETVCKGPSYPPPTHPHPKSGTQAKCGFHIKLLGLIKWMSHLKNIWSRLIAALQMSFIQQNLCTVETIVTVKSRNNPITPWSNPLMPVHESILSTILSTNLFYDTSNQ